jgi:hypothetical protein
MYSQWRKTENRGGPLPLIYLYAFQISCRTRMTDLQHVMDKTPAPNSLLSQNWMRFISSHELLEQGVEKSHASGISCQH